MELVALLPVVVVLCAALWQCALAGHAAWAVSGAARAAARAEAVGGDPEAAARGRLPRGLERGLRVRRGDRVEVSVLLPRVPGLPSLGRVSATGRFARQS